MVHVISDLQYIFDVVKDTLWECRRCDVIWDVLWYDVTQSFCIFVFVPKATPCTDAVSFIPDNRDNTVHEVLHLPQLVKLPANLIEELNICDYYMVSAFFDVLDSYQLMAYRYIRK